MAGGAERAGWSPFLAAPAGGGPARVEPVAVEEPLEIRVRGRPFAVLLRTPGRERDLIAGFLASERVLRGPEDLLAVEPCPPVEPRAGEEPGEAWNVALAEGVRWDPGRERATAMVGSACGACGTRMIEDLRRELPRRAGGAAPTPAPGALRAAFEELRRRQAGFALTAGMHGAALAALGASGELLLRDAAEDVGRHNAVDKLLGARLRAGEWPLEGAAALLVSGRVSFEIVQKAALAGVALVAGVGMPTSLAVRAARAAGLGLTGFVRGDGGLRYAPEPG
jgi:FdhD protein